MGSVVLGLLRFVPAVDDTALLPDPESFLDGVIFDNAPPDAPPDDPGVDPGVDPGCVINPEDNSCAETPGMTRFSRSSICLSRSEYADSIVSKRASRISTSLRAFLRLGGGGFPRRKVHSISPAY